MAKKIEEKTSSQVEKCYCMSCLIGNKKQAKNDRKNQKKIKKILHNLIKQKHDIISSQFFSFFIFHHQ